jgi:hypothetical protein
MKGKKNPYIFGYLLEPCIENLVISLRFSSHLGFLKKKFKIFFFFAQVQNFTQTKKKRAGLLTSVTRSQQKKTLITTCPHPKRGSTCGARKTNLGSDNKNFNSC